METNNGGQKIRLGLVVNPYAGVGGVTANKGSDDACIQKLAASGQIALVAPSRATVFFQQLAKSVSQTHRVTVVTVGGLMGADYVAAQSFQLEQIDYTVCEQTTPVDTQKAVQLICHKNVDLLVFVGGDGTARDVYKALHSSPMNKTQLVLGVPSGVKMHSSVFAINPQMAAEIVAGIVSGALLRVSKQEVRDIDEQAFREGVVKSRFFGELMTPKEDNLLQKVKQGGFEYEDLILLGMAEYLESTIDENTLIIMGPGSTTLSIQNSWGLDGTLLGVDLIKNGQVDKMDANEQDILKALDSQKGPTLLVITVIGGQGHIIGRGNQQISSQVLKLVGKKNVIVVSTKTKLKTLSGRPFIVDSGDMNVDKNWEGYIPVVTDYDDIVMYRVGY